MKQDNRPLSPYMIGPYYPPQLTSIMSITHRASGVFLSIVGAPLLLWWIIAVSNGPESYNSLVSFLGGWVGKLGLLAVFFCISFHTLNGIRHLIWDTGRALEIKVAYRLGWAVIGGTILLTLVLAGVLL
jgi:succinate dehydrogenase / fumarate reductase cytochrome b subunit